MIGFPKRTQDDTIVFTIFTEDNNIEFYFTLDDRITHKKDRKYQYLHEVNQNSFLVTDENMGLCLYMMVSDVGSQLYSLITI